MASACDLMSQETKYHSKCLVSLYNRCRLAVNARQGKNKNTVCEGLALADIIRFIEETLAVTDESHPVFITSDLTKMYLSRLHDLLCTDSGLTDINTCNCTYVHNTRLRERILCHFPEMHAQKVGNSYLLLCNQKVGDAKRRVCETNYDEDALCLSKAAKVVRIEMLKT